MPDIPQGEDFFTALGDTAAYHEPLIKLSGMTYMPPTKLDMKQIQQTSTAADSARSHDALALIRRKIDAAFTAIDLVVVPTDPEPASPDHRFVEGGDGKPQA